MLQIFILRQLFTKFFIQNGVILTDKKRGVWSCLFLLSKHSHSKGKKIFQVSSSEKKIKKKKS